MSNIKFTEKFLSFQGEGIHTGKSTLWLRLFQCNLECRGFNQPVPSDPSTYLPVGNDRDLIDIKQLEDLPVFEYGCDSAYSVSQRYKHLVPEATAYDIANSLSQLLPGGTFYQHSARNNIHMCFTGGEPLMRPNQRAIEQVMREFHQRSNLPRFVTVETNGTQKLSTEFQVFVEWFLETHRHNSSSSEWLWSVSPKLHNTSGETNSVAIKPDVVASYQNISPNGQLKFVVNGTSETWNELESVVQQFRDAGVEFPVWIMPVGATKEQQEGEHIKRIVYEALNRGYNVSGRLHAYMLGNGMGT